MKSFKKFATRLVTMAIFIFLPFVVTTYANQRFVDVPTTHWAHEAIINISDNGFMVGNVSGEFRPDAPLDKFETSRILANVAGFRIVNLTPEEEALINLAYSNFSETLREMENTFERWNSATNREVAYLLQLNVLTINDINNFIVVNNDSEQLRALSRQEATMFLVRVLGLSAHAGSGIYAQLFNDDGNIATQLRHYVYFLRANNVISGDTYGNFNPNIAVNRASFAIMLYRAMQLPNQFTQYDTELITGTVLAIYQTISAIQIQTSSGSPIFRVANDATIRINNEQATFSDISQNIQISATLVDGVIQGIVGTSTSVGLPQTASTPLPQTSIPTPPATPITLPDSTIAAIVTDVYNNVITLQLRLITPMGDIVTEEISFLTNSNTNVYLGDTLINFLDIRDGDIVDVIVNSGNALEIRVTERVRNFTGTLMERIQLPYANTISYIIKESEMLQHQLLVTNTTILERAGHGSVQWDQIRIGDTVEVTAEGSNLTSVFAFSQTSTVEGVVESVVFRQGVSYLVLNQDGIGTNTYFITGTLQDMHQITIGSRVRLVLDSLEVQNFTILSLG